MFGFILVARFGTFFGKTFQSEVTNIFGYQVISMKEFAMLFGIYLETFLVLNFAY